MSKEKCIIYMQIFGEKILDINYHKVIIHIGKIQNVVLDNTLFKK